MTRDEIARRLLTACTARLDTDEGPQGTAFFVAPGYAITAAHVVRGAAGLRVRLTEGSDTWQGHVEDARPPGSPDVLAMRQYPPPDAALIKIDHGPAHACALLGTGPPASGRMMTRGYTQTLGGTAETETFRLTGDLETANPGFTLLKLGLGQVSRGMSGAPVIDLKAGEVIGMLRTSRDVKSNLGGWVVPASVIRQLWAEEASAGNDAFHQGDSRWRDLASQLNKGARANKTEPGREPVPLIQGEVVTIITGGAVGDVTITNRSTCGGTN